MDNYNRPRKFLHEPSWLVSPHLHGQCSGFHHQRFVFPLPRFPENEVHVFWTLTAACLLTLNRELLILSRVHSEPPAIRQGQFRFSGTCFHGGPGLLHHEVHCDALHPPVFSILGSVVCLWAQLSDGARRSWFLVCSALLVVRMVTPPQAIFMASPETEVSLSFQLCGIYWGFLKNYYW